MASVRGVCSSCACTRGRAGAATGDAPGPWRVAVSSSTCCECRGGAGGTCTGGVCGGVCSDSDGDGGVGSVGVGGGGGGGGCSAAAAAAVVVAAEAVVAAAAAEAAAAAAAVDRFRPFARPLHEANPIGERLKRALRVGRDLERGSLRALEREAEKARKRARRDCCCSSSCCCCSSPSCCEDVLASGASAQCARASSVSTNASWEAKTARREARRACSLSDMPQPGAQP